EHHHEFVRSDLERHVIEHQSAAEALADAPERQTAHRRSPYSRRNTTTDLAGSVTESVPPFSVAPENAVGCTASGVSKVLRASMAEAVRTSPLTCFGCAPVIDTDSALADFASRFASARKMAPSDP